MNNILLAIMSAEPAVEPQTNLRNEILKIKINKMLQWVFLDARYKISISNAVLDSNEVNYEGLVNLMDSRPRGEYNIKYTVRKLNEYLKVNSESTMPSIQALILKCYIDSCGDQYDPEEIVKNPKLVQLIEKVGINNYMHVYLGYLETIEDVFSFLQGIAVICCEHRIPNKTEINEWVKNNGLAWALSKSK